MKNSINGNIRQDMAGETYTWSNRKFKKWKKKLKKLYKEKYNRSFNQDIPNPQNRELIYKKMLGMQDIDIFSTGNIGKIYNADINEEILKNVTLINNILD